MADLTLSSPGYAPIISSNQPRPLARAASIASDNGEDPASVRLNVLDEATNANNQVRNPRYLLVFNVMYTIPQVILIQVTLLGGDASCAWHGREQKSMKGLICSSARELPYAAAALLAFSFLILIGLFLKWLWFISIDQTMISNRIPYREYIIEISAKAEKWCHKVEFIKIIFTVMATLWLMQSPDVSDEDDTKDCLVACPFFRLILMTVVIMQYIVICLPCLVMLCLLPFLCLCLPCADSSNSSPQGATRDQLATLPVVTFDKSTTNFRLEDCVCSICLGTYEDGEELRALPHCKHHFHKECVDNWLVVNSTCPTCRTGVIKENPIQNDDIEEGGVEMNSMGNS